MPCHYTNSQFHKQYNKDTREQAPRHLSNNEKRYKNVKTLIDLSYY